MEDNILIKKGSTLFLKGVVLLITLAVAAFAAFTINVLFKNDLDEYTVIVSCMFLSTLPAFGILYLTMRLLNLIDNNNAFSQFSVAALKNIKYLAIIITVLYAAASPLFYYIAETDDAPGVLMIALVLGFASTVVATFAAVLQRILQDALDLKSENDLTV